MAVVTQFPVSCAALVAWANVGTSILRPDEVGNWLSTLGGLSLHIDAGVFVHLVDSEGTIKGTFSPDHFDEIGFSPFVIDSDGVGVKWLSRLESETESPSVLPVLLDLNCDWEIRVPLYSASRGGLVGLLAFGGSTSGGNPNPGVELISFVRAQIESCMSRLTYGGEVEQLRRRQGRTVEVSRAVSRAMHDFVLYVDQRGVISFASDSHSRLGKDPTRLIGLSAISLFHPDDWEGFIDWERNLLKTGTVEPAEFRIQLGHDRCEDGSAWVEVVGSLVDARGVGGYVIIGRDTTERRIMERALRDSEARYRTVVELAGEGIWQVDWQGNTLFMNSRMSQLLHVDDPSTCRVADHLSAEVLGEIGIDGLTAKDFESHQIEVEVSIQGVPSLWTLLQYRAMVESSGRGSLLMMFADISDLVESRKELAELARIDSLTGLANRYEILRRLRLVIEDSGTNYGPGVFFIDVDDFKSVNDSCGHSGGDELLVELANRLCRAVRYGDLVGRLGGDEFVIVAENLASQMDQRRLFARLRGVFEAPFSVAGRDLAITASIGFAASNGVVDAIGLLDKADREMYRIKASRC